MRLVFESELEAQAILFERFPEWDGEKTPYVNVSNDHLVIVTEPVKLNEEGEALPSTWTGIHIDLLLSEESDEYNEFEVEVNTPAHRFSK